MATLYFKIGADYDKVIRLCDEIKKTGEPVKEFWNIMKAPAVYTPFN